MIYIVSGDIRSGKTTALQHWIKGWQNIKGILCPDNEDNIRNLYLLGSDALIPFQVKETEEDVVEVGRFKFLSSSFQMANDALIADFENGDFEYLIIDELGKLELKNQGLHRSAKHIFGSDVEGKNIVLVVRSFMVEQIIAHYNIRNYKVVSIEELP